jgi:ubiquitin-conjugating enzyme E2 variant
MASVLGFSTWLSHTAWTTMGAEQLPWVAATALLAYLGADLLSGLVHWAADRLGDERTPILGPALIRPFREHHADPLAITHHDFVETNGNNCIVAAPVLMLVLFLMPRETGVLFYTCVVIACTALFVFCTNQFHKWAHQKNPAPLIRLMQRAGLILSPEHHVIHHTAPRDKYYCITVGWMNPVLEKIRFFRFLEKAISRIHPRALRPHPDDRPQSDPDAAIAMPS